MSSETDPTSEPEPAHSYADHGPIALNGWQAGSHSYLNVLPTIEKRVRAIAGSRRRELAQYALLARTTEQTSRNVDSLAKAKFRFDELDEAETAVVNGEVSTERYIQFLGQYPELGSIEIARLIHPGDWHVRRHIDDPVRSALYDAAHGLDSREITEDADGDDAVSYYKIKQFNNGHATHNHSVVVERKRRICRSLGEQATTVVRNTLLIDGNHAPRNLGRHIGDELAKMRRSNYNYDQHSDELYDALETHMRTPDCTKKPRWAIPLMTTYFTYLSAGDTREQNLVSDDAARQ